MKNFVDYKYSCGFFFFWKRGGGGGGGRILGGNSFRVHAEKTGILLVTFWAVGLFGGIQL